MRLIYSLMEGPVWAIYGIDHSRGRDLFVGLLPFPHCAHHHAI